MAIGKLIVPFGESVKCNFCKQEVIGGAEVFASYHMGIAHTPVFCMECYKVSFEECKPVIEERIMRKRGS